ncbi:MAG: sulfite exporter TauE/SafE family protein [Pseudomonadota bacterium]
MDIFSLIGFWPTLAAMALGLVAGFVKGAVGFALPMILISGLSSFLEPKTALAALIVPALATNIWQGLRDGPRNALQSARKHWLYIALILFFIIVSAQFIAVIPVWAYFLCLGIPVVGFSAVQLFGWQPHIPPRRRRLAEIVIGTFAGLIGGLSGVWGPPTVLYLTALGTEKSEQMRLQGVIFGMSACMLLVAHIQSGVLNASTLPLSIAMLAPCLLGLGIGLWANDRLDQARFRQLTLIVLIIAGLNLVRRGLAGLLS